MPRQVSYLPPIGVGGIFFLLKNDILFIYTDNRFTMLNELIDSKQESVIYGFFLVSPERSFSLHELARRLGITQTKLAVALAKMVKLGYLRVFSKRGKKYYIVNSKFKLFPSLQTSLVKNQPKFEDELFIAIKKLGDVSGAYLTGIFSGHPELPVDILLIGKIGPKRLESFVKNCEKMMGQEVNYCVMTAKEFEIRKDSFDKFIRDIFDYRFITVVPFTKSKKKNE